MKRLIQLMALAIGFTLVGCTEEVNVVEGVKPVSRVMYDEAHLWNTQLAEMAPAEREAHLRKAAPQLETKVVYYLKQLRKISQSAQAERVEFFFGNMEDVRAEDGDGEVRNGYFRDQIVARVFIKGQAQPYDVLVQCLNGVFALPGGGIEGLQALGERQVVEQFTIGRGEGLVHHVSYEMAMDLAERFNLPIYSGRRAKNRITIDQARRLETETDRIKVTVRVYEGDHFDLQTMTYTPVAH